MLSSHEAIHSLFPSLPSIPHAKVDCGRDYGSFIRNNKLLNLLLDQSASFFLLTDLITSEFQFVSAGMVRVVGHSMDFWLANGEKAFHDLIHPHDLGRLQQVYDDQREFFQSLSVDHREGYACQFEYRVRNVSEGYTWILVQRSVVEYSADREPRIVFDICTDITNLKKDDTITLSFISLDRAQVARTSLEYPRMISCPFTVREVEILKQLQLGFSSKEISRRFNISEYTVSKHRQNMMTKAKVTNTASLLNYAWKHGCL